MCSDDVVQLIASLCRIVIAQIQVSVMREDEEDANQIRVIPFIGVAALFVEDERSAGIALRKHSAVAALEVDVGVVGDIAADLFNIACLCLLGDTCHAPFYSRF